MNNARNYNTFGLVPTDGSPKPRSGRSYRAARRNAARAAKWIARRRFRKEPNFDGLYGGLTGSGVHCG